MKQEVIMELSHCVLHLLGDRTSLIIGTVLKVGQQ